MSSFSQPKIRIKSPILIKSNNINNSKKNNTIYNEDNTSINNLKIQNTICNLIDVINDNNLNFFYQDNISSFKYNIDQLNLKFYLETEKILSSTDRKIHNENKLFLILFKQINLYIKEIERLNTILMYHAKEPDLLKKKMVIFSQKKTDFETKELLIQTLKNSIKSLEKKLSKIIQSENKLREENKKLKKDLEYYEQLYENYSNNISSITIKDRNKDIKKKKNKRTFSGINQSFMSNGTIIINSKSKNDFNLYGKTQKKISSKLKIIKAVKNKISYISKKNKYSNISNTNTTSKTNNNFNSNSESNRSTNLIEEHLINKKKQFNFNITKIKKAISNPFCSHHLHYNSHNINNNNIDDINFSLINNNLNKGNIINEIKDIEIIQDLLTEVKDYLTEKNQNYDCLSLYNDNIYNENVSNGNFIFDKNFCKKIGYLSYNGKEKNELKVNN